MKMIELEYIECKGLSDADLQEINGGFLPLLIIGAALLVGCTTQVNSGGTNNTTIQCQEVTIINNYCDGKSDTTVVNK